MTPTARAVRIAVQNLEQRHRPGSNPLLTRAMWDDMVRAAGFNVLAERVDASSPNVVDATEVVRLVQEAVNQSYPGFSSLVEAGN